MIPGKLYKLKRGNQSQQVGFVIKGLTASVQLLGSTSIPADTSEMEDCTDGETLTNGTWQFGMLPEYIAFVGAGTDSIDILGMSYDDLGTIA